jgi:hypothetical protein
MAALSDYLESGILKHIFFGETFTSPTNISIGLTSSVPIDTDTGATIRELPSGAFKGSNFVDTGYRRISLGASSDGNDKWNQVGIDSTTAFQVYSYESGVGLPPNSGYFYPLYLSLSKAISESTAGTPSATALTFEGTFPGVTFYGPDGVYVSGDYSSTDPGYTVYDGNGFIKNKNQLAFPTANTDWGYISGIVITDSEFVGSGNLLMYAELQNPRNIFTGDSIKFDTNSLEISLK